MARRKMTLRRIDPWSVLKFGFVVNVCLLAILLLGFGVLWFAVRQLGLIEQACQLATEVGFEECGVNGGNLFRILLLLGVLGVVITTGLYVFFAFLHNLLSDLVGGITVTVQEEGVAGSSSTVASRSRPATQDTRRAATTGERTVPTAPTAPPESAERPVTPPRPSEAGAAAWPWERPTERPEDASSSRPAGDESARRDEPGDRPAHDDDALFGGRRPDQP